jgi:hypothetical protein
MVRGTTNPGRQVAVANKFRPFALNIFRPSAMKFPSRLTSGVYNFHLAPRLYGKICEFPELNNLTCRK